MTIIATLPSANIPKVLPAPFVLENVSWELYERLLRETDGQHLRMTYDEGRLVLMSPLQPHEYFKTALGRLIELTVLELDISCLPLGSTTWRRKKLRKGLEADECYDIQNEPVVRSSGRSRRSTWTATRRRTWPSR